MAWCYALRPLDIPHHSKYHLRTHLARYKQAGIKVWGAAAFKGASNVTADLPQPEDRIANIQAWVKAAGGYGLKGLIATGWSRYSTFYNPCESLETAWDLLALAGIAMWNGNMPRNGLA